VLHIIHKHSYRRLYAEEKIFSIEVFSIDLNSDTIGAVLKDNGIMANLQPEALSGWIVEGNIFKLISDW